MKNRRVVLNVLTLLVLSLFFGPAADSIKASKGVAAADYERADEGGGYEWVGFLQEHPKFCSLSGVIKGNRSDYGTTVNLYFNARNPPTFDRSIEVSGEQYRFPLPIRQGTYLVKPEGRFVKPARGTGPRKVRSSDLLKVYPESLLVKCERDGALHADFEIR